MSRSIRARLSRLELDLDRAAGSGAITWDELLALYEGARADDGNGRPVPPPGRLHEALAGRALDWDSLCRSARPPRDPATIVTEPSRALAALRAIPTPAP